MTIPSPEIEIIKIVSYIILLLFLFLYCLALIYHYLKGKRKGVSKGG